MEDLWAFNEEAVVRAVAFCPVPVISAVGHETDVTLCDFAADMRAPTPSAAAELAVPEREALLAAIDDMVFSFRQAAHNAVLQHKNSLMRLEGRLLAREPRIHVQKMLLHAGHLQDRLLLAADKQLDKAQTRLDSAASKLMSVGPMQALGRGYAIALKDGRPVTSVNQATDEMTLVFRDGRAQVRVISAERGMPFGSQKE